MFLYMWLKSPPNPVPEQKTIYVDKYLTKLRYTTVFLACLGVMEINKNDGHKVDKNGKRISEYCHEALLELLKQDVPAYHQATDTFREREKMNFDKNQLDLFENHDIMGK